MPSRRGFLTSATAAFVAVPSLGGEQRPEIVDCHTHFYDPTRPEGVPWPGRDDKILYRRVLPDEFRKLTQPHGITGTVVVEASPRLDDNAWLLELARQHPIVLGVVGNLDPRIDSFDRNLRRFAENRKFRGIRLNQDLLRTQLDQSTFRRAMGLMADLDLELDVNGGPDMPREVARLAQLLPRLRIVINHAANVRIDGKAPPRAWMENLRAAAEHRNVFCKVSALVEGTGRNQGNAPRDVAYYQPVLDILWNTFGEDRLIYGSNWPVSDRFASYATLFTIVRDYFRGKGERAVNKFFAANAHVAYKWPRE